MLVGSESERAERCHRLLPLFQLLLAARLRLHAWKGDLPWPLPARLLNVADERGKCAAPHAGTEQAFVDEMRAATDVPREWMGAVQHGTVVQQDVAYVDQEEPVVVALVLLPADSGLAKSQEASSVVQRSVQRGDYSIQLAFPQPAMMLV